MKRLLFKKVLTFALATIMVFGLVACSGGKNKDSSDNATPAEASDQNSTPVAGGKITKDTPFVIGVQTLDGKFSSFFNTSVPDREIVNNTVLTLLRANKDGVYEASNDKPTYAESYKVEVADDQSSTKYSFVLKNDLKFSDGSPITVDDLIFAMHVYAHPYYDGNTTFFNLAIEGMQEYRLQTSTEMVAVGEDILKAGISGEPGATEPTMGTGLTVATADQQKAFWSYLPEAGEKFAQEIIDYCVGNLLNDDNAQGALEKSAADVEGSDSLKAAFGMAMWGFGQIKDGKFVTASGAEYDLADSSALNAKVYWDELVKSYGYNLSDEDGLNSEKAGDKLVQDYVQELFFHNEGGVQGGVPSISGIKKTKATGEDGAEHDAIEVTLKGIDPSAIFKIGDVDAASKAYYTEGYEGELNEVGVDPSGPEFIQHLKAKNDKPFGAGPYIFESYKDNVVTFTANPNFIMGEPKIKTLRYQVLEQGSELDALKTGTVHFAEPSASQQVVTDISSGEGDYSKLDYILVDNDGYGYIGINGQAIPDWNVRKAIAHSFNIEEAVANYYGELASVNNRTMSKVVWAYPDNPEALYPYDASGETSKQLLLDAGYVYDEATKQMQYPAGHEKAGQQLTIKYTLPSAAEEHPSGQVFIGSQKLLESLGVKVDIEVDPNLLSKLSTAYESGIQVWAAAWGGGGVDPDMFQIWYSDPTVNKGGSPNNTGLYWLYQNGSDDQKAVLKSLNEQIIAGRSSLDPEERKPFYAKALELSTSMAVEVPTYQRKNMFAYNKDVVNADSLINEKDVTPFQSPIGDIWNVELNW